MKKLPTIPSLLYSGQPKVFNSLIGKFANSLILCLALFLSVSAAESPSAIYIQANKAYKAGQYEQAASAYESIIGKGYKLPEVYYNLGNCYYKLNNISKSILNYERALNLSPGDEDIQHNLKMANLQIVDKIQPVPQMGIVKSWNSFTASNSARAWAMWSVGFTWLAFFVFAAYLFTGNRKLFFTSGFILLFLSLSAGLLSYKQNRHEQDSNMAILTVPNVFAKSAPDAEGNNLFMLNEGLKFQVLDEVGDWKKIRLADGRVGWIEKENFEKI